MDNLGSKTSINSLRELFGNNYNRNRNVHLTFKSESYPFEDATPQGGVRKSRIRRSGFVVVAASIILQKAGRARVKVYNLFGSPSSAVHLSSICLRTCRFKIYPKFCSLLVASLPKTSSSSVIETCSKS